MKNIYESLIDEITNEIRDIAESKEYDPAEYETVEDIASQMHLDVLAELPADALQRLPSLEEIALDICWTVLDNSGINYKYYGLARRFLVHCLADDARMCWDASENMDFVIDYSQMLGTYNGRAYIIRNLSENLLSVTDAETLADGMQLINEVAKLPTVAQRSCLKL